MTKWTWFDYLDESNVSVIQAWLDTFKPKLREQIRSKLLMRFLTADAEGALKYPGFGKLKGKHRDIIEIRFERNKIVYRVLCCTGDMVGEVWLLAGAIEQNDQIRPYGVFDSALDRRAIIMKSKLRRGPTCLLKKTR